ncbi:NupC/NupG family nucleoside CNT transporter [Microbulbifer bruguierae]|uniref:Nucleoside permease n=2 Tax=Microbulbifer bruguierae TaxID=3029061 RepID=A0ABY8NI32_9GAMM|nr:NupC/NupG family nucleoside CNT transporter [Microbulbifer bruguierae]WGL18566.1 NupC/NupG family nucleoside CNT transporter [Microbulbifer bruguierae]
MLLLLGFALLASSQRSSISVRTVGIAFALQFLIGGFALFVPFGKSVLNTMSAGISQVLSYGTNGIEFLFGDIGRGNIGFIFAFNVLPIIIFFSSLIAVLYYLGIMGWTIRVLGGGMQKLLGTSRAESMSATANIFVSQTEAPVVIQPYIRSMTQSELFAVMVGGMASVAGSVLAGYVGLGVDLKYLLAASFMAAPGGFLMAKLIVPETVALTVSMNDEAPLHESWCNIFDAAAHGATNGLRLAVNIGAMLLAFISLIAMLNGVLGWFGGLFGFAELSLQWLLGQLFQPIAFMIGVPWDEASTAGSLIGQKLVLNEFFAYVEFSGVKEQLSLHTQAVVTFALCGFANFSSIAILLGGLATMAPNRRDDVARLGLRAVLAAFLANLMSAAIASFFIALAPGWSI